MDSNEKDKGFSLRTLVDHLTGQHLEYSLERQTNGYYRAQIPIIGTNERVQLVDFEVIPHSGRARLSVNLVPFGSFPLAETSEPSNNVFVQYIQHDERLHILSVERRSFQPLEIQSLVLTQIQPVLQNKGGGDHSQLASPINELQKSHFDSKTPDLSQRKAPIEIIKPLVAAAKELEVKTKLETLNAPRSDVRIEEQKTPESSIISLKEKDVLKVDQLRKDIPLEVTAGSLSKITTPARHDSLLDLSYSLEQRLKNEHYLLENGNISLDENEYALNKILTYDVAAEILEKNVPAFKQILRNHHVPTEAGVNSANILKIKLFENATPYKYTPLTLQELVTLYGSSQKQLQEAERAGLFRLDIKFKENPRVFRTQQRQAFYEIFDTFVERRTDNILPELHLVKEQPAPKKVETRKEINLEGKKNLELIGTNLEHPLSLLTQSLETKLVSEGYVLPLEKKIILEGKQYFPQTILKYDYVATLLEKTEGALYQYLRNNKFQTQKGISAVNALKIKLFETYPGVLSLDQLTELYHCNLPLINEAQKQGLFTPKDYKPKGWLLVRTVQRNVFFTVFDSALEHLLAQSPVFTKDHGKTDDKPVPLSIQPVKKSDDKPRPQIELEKKKEPEFPQSRKEVEPISYKLVYNNENEKEVMRKVVDVYQDQFNRRKLEILLASGEIKGNLIKLGKKSYVFTDYVPLEDVAQSFGKTQKNIHKKYHDLPLELKRNHSSEFMLSSFTALVFYPLLDVANVPVSLHEASCDILLDPEEQGIDRGLLWYLKEGKITTYAEGKPALHPHAFHTLSKSLRYNWASIMTDQKRRTDFMTAKGYVDETSAMHLLTGNGVPVEEAYSALDKRLQAHVVLGMIPKIALEQLRT